MRKPPQPDCYDYVRRAYGVPAYIGVRVKVRDREGVLVEAKHSRHYVHIRLDGDPRSGVYHPTDGVGYRSLPADTAANWRAVFGFPADTTPSLAAVDAAYKAAARTHHPDRGGTDAGMAHVNRARDYALQELEP